MKRLVPLICFFLMLLSGAAMAEEVYVGYCDTLLKSTDGADSRVGDTELGLVTADALRAVCGTELSLLPARCLGANLEAGRLTRSLVERSVPEKSRILTAQVTPAQLRDILECSLEGLVFDPESERIDRAATRDGEFLQISGFRFRYDATAAAGERLWSLETDDGARYTEYPSQPVYTIAFPACARETNAALAELDAVDAGVGSLADALIGYMQSRDGRLAAPEGEKRVSALGAGENQLVEGIPTGLWVMVAVLVLIFSGARYRKQTRTR